MEQSRGSALIRVGAFVLTVLLVAGAVVFFLGRVHRAAASADTAAPVPGEGAGGRVVVEVLNASGRVGLARAATRRLRAAGLDVVYFGSDTTAALDSTQVLARRGDPAPARRAAKALGVGVVRTAPDPGRLVDVTVRLGRDFAAAPAAPAVLDRQP